MPVRVENFSKHELLNGKIEIQGNGYSVTMEPKHWDALVAAERPECETLAEAERQAFFVWCSQHGKG
jgi:hypothetical protein